jgi:hypothetical protein
MNIAMNRRKLVVLALLSPLMASCAAAAPEGPGMTVSFGNGINGKLLIFKSARSSTGEPFVDPGGLAPDKHPEQGGKAAAASSDYRALPEWVEFEWTESDYGVKHTREELLAMPVHKARVPVRERVPQAVIDEVVAANHQRQAGQLPDKSLWVYFVWYDTGVKFRWELRSGCCQSVRAGGDAMGR